MAANICVILSGCGYLDGAEVQEAVLTLYFLDRAGAKVTCFAPDRDQMHVVDHQTGEEVLGHRNVRVESARIARGNVRDLADASMGDFDALVMPGGYGVAKNLSSFAVDGPSGDVDGNLVRLVGEASELRKPVVAICISPAVLAVALGKHGRSSALTIGNDDATASAIASTGSTHETCAVDATIVDAEARVISTPAYMLGPSPAKVGAGIEAAIDQLMKWLG